MLILNAGPMAKMAPRPGPEMFAKFAKFAEFAIFDPALEYPTRIHRQAPRSRSLSKRECLCGRYGSCG
jgi:hypothetical protein